MGVNEVMNIITTVGFPIAVCLVCFWYINKMQEQHKAETDNLAEAINNNTLVMQELVSQLNGR